MLNESEKERLCKTQYEVTIKRIGQWVSRGKEYKKIADTGNEKDGGIVYGYVYSDSIEQGETLVLKQTLDTIDLPAVIKAINGL